MVFGKRRKCRRSPVRQRDLSDCGPACLASVCAGYGLHVAISRIRQIAGTDKRGTSVFGLVETAIELGFDAKAVRTGYESLAGDSMPAIVHVMINGRFSHYMVVDSITPTYIIVMDPAVGRYRKISAEKFNNIWTGVSILLVPGENFRENGKKSSLQRIFSLAAPHSGELFFAGVCAIVVSGTGVVHSYYIKEIIDEILPHGQIELLNILSATIITTLLIQLLTARIKNKMVLRVSRQINSSLVTSYYRHVMHLPKQFFDNMRTGEIVSRINDVAKISAFINEVVISISIDVLIIAFSLSFMFIYNWQMAVVALAIAPVYILLYAIARSHNKRWQHRIMESTAEFEGELVESLGAMTTVRYLALEDHFCNKADAKFGRLLQNIYRFSIRQLSIEQSADFTTRLFTVILLWTGAYFVIGGKLTTGELVSFYALLAYFTMPVLNLINFNRSYGEAKVAAERLFEILDLRTIDAGVNEHFIAHTNPVTIEFRNVKFRYGNNLPVLDNVNLVVESGKVTGIRGRSGSGKSTLVALLAKSVEPEAGGILINGIALHEMSRESVTDLISIAPQQAELFTGTIAENIMIGREVNFDQLNRISEQLGIIEFASRLPDGMNTFISEHGGNLSGGQRQRISIARALYRNTPVLIFDEATAGIDTQSEEKIMQTIEWYKNQGNTVIIIGHHDTTLKICDNIAVLEDGVIK